MESCLNRPTVHVAVIGGTGRMISVQKPENALTVDVEDYYQVEAFSGTVDRANWGRFESRVEDNTGRILDALKANGVDENTLVIFTSDNGPWLIKGDHGGSAKPFRDGKGSSYEGGQRVPCVMRWPARIPAGTECAEIIAT